ncbi:hypothetical protein VTH06DRAFT_1282, partial [Thermothelomyces fergusii]
MPLDYDEETSSQHSEEDYEDSLVDEDDEDDEDGWADEYGELDPSDSASISQAHKQRALQRPQSPRSVRGQQRRHRIPVGRQSYSYYSPSAPSMSLDPSDDYAAYARGYGGPPQPQSHGAFFSPRGGHQSVGYAQSHVGYMSNPYGSQMVPYNEYRNPFAPAPMAGPGAGFYGSEHPAGHGHGHYDLTRYHQGPGYYGAGGGAGYAMLPPHMQPYLYNAPPPPPTEAPTPKPPTPVPEKNPEVEALKAQLAKFEEEEKKKAEREQMEELKKKMQEEAAEALRKQMEEMKRVQEEQKRA